MTDDDFRDLVLALDGASEGTHMGHPDFRVNNRIFASLRADGSLAMVKLAVDQQAVFLREHPAMFTPSPGAWGRQGCTDVVLAKATTRPVRAAAQLAWEAALAKPRPKTLARSKPGNRSGSKRPRARR
ncbi:MAG: MmcQ/YjbR family DNA-binding protein [Vicinamibacterales bacterium]